MLQSILRMTAVAGLALGLTTTAYAAEWGNLKGRFVYEGKYPTPADLDVAKEALCAKHPVVNEELIVNEDDLGIKDVVIYVSSKKVKVHPDYEKTAKDTVVMDNKHCRFQPHVVAMRLSQTLELHNSDPFSHNTNLQPFGDEPANNLISEDSKFTHTFNKTQKLPVPVVCNIHGWMKGYVVVRDDPYAAVSDEHGNFELKNLPAEELEFTVWQEKSGWLAAGKGWSKKGVFKHQIKPGDNDLKEIKVSAALFIKKK
jgi:plastocyanin